MQEDNATKLEQMRQTVDERLTATLEQRLGESFKQVSERLEAVHKGLGEMQTLAAGVGDLKQVLTNVKTRGTWGEVQLGMLLEQILTPDQYEANVACKLGCGERVEFAIRLPGQDGQEGDAVWLPIDAKFPVEDYQRMLEAQERGDLPAMEAALKALEARVKASAKDIQTKYLDPPRTTDFGIMFLPTEGLYAEVLRRPGLAESLQRDCRVVDRRPDHSGGTAQQPADGLPHPGHREAFERGVAAAGGGEDPVRAVRRTAGQGAQEARPGLHHHRGCGQEEPDHRAQAEDRAGAAGGRREQSALAHDHRGAGAGRRRRTERYRLRGRVA